jgi:ribosomal protein S1
MHLAEPKFNEEIEKMFSQTLRRGQVVRGEVISISDDSVAVNIGYKYDGIVPIDEFSGKLPEAGEEIPVIVRKIDDRGGVVILSYRSAERREAFQRINQYFNEKKPIRGKIIRKVKDGYLVDLGVRFFKGILLNELSGLRPGEILEPEEEIEAYIDAVDFKRRRVILDRERFINEKKKEEIESYLSTVKVGDKFKGKIKNITDFGVFVEIGPVDVLVRKFELSWKRVEHPSEIFKEGDEVELVVISVDREKQRIQGSIRLAKKTRWHILAERINPGDIFEGTVKKKSPDGIYVWLMPGLDGLLPKEEFSKYIRDVSLLNVGDHIRGRVKEIIPELRRIILTHPTRSE